ncbi:DUF2971 domain-containing protein [Terrabacter aeriphilus]|uniref:DUF2971 domain-containing protein n=1 Tax=Terrabacter aeriphilus TaxID=515662 RepID=A0ABP9JHI8_9MICO
MTLPALLPEAIRIASGPVFHYTSARGLIAVVQSGRVWASEASSLNDRAEVRQGWDSIQSHLEDHQDSDAGRWLMDLASDGHHKKGHDVFMLCASTRGDDANQWRLYAAEGRGYALELDSSVQLAAFSEKAPTRPGGTGGKRLPFNAITSSASVTPWMHVLYTDDEIARVVDELVTRAGARLEQVDRETDSEAKDFYGEQVRDDAHEALEGIAHLIKSPGFSGENEVRAVATFAWGRDHVGYRESPTGVAGYAVLTSAPDGRGDIVCGPPHIPSLPIDGVRLGPLLAEENIPTIQGLLSQHNLRDARVDQSAVPLR